MHSLPLILSPSCAWCILYPKPCMCSWFPFSFELKTLINQKAHFLFGFEGNNTVPRVLTVIGLPWKVAGVQACILTLKTEVKMCRCQSMSSSFCCQLLFFRRVWDLQRALHEVCMERWTSGYNQKHCASRLAAVYYSWVLWAIKYPFHKHRCMYSAMPVCRKVYTVRLRSSLCTCPSWGYCCCDST